MKTLITLLLAFSLHMMSAQQSVSYETQPLSWNLTQKYDQEAVRFDNVPFDRLAKEDAVNDLDKSIPWRFGYDFPTRINPSTHGQKITFRNGDQLWRVRLQSPGAKTMNVFFNWFELQEGSWMRVSAYQEDGDTSKLFTHEQNNVNKAIGIWPVEADDIWVELYEPQHLVGTSRLEIGNVIHGYRTLTDFDAAKALNDSGSCNQDVNCDITPGGADPFNINQVKENVKKSAAMLVSGNTGFCSGALVNNTNNDQAPLFLTANHCLGGGVSGWAFRFNWRSTVNRCASTSGSVSGGFDQTASGATLLMSSDKSDMALVNITDTGFFNASPDVAWAGWNRSTSYTPQINFGVHHPSGDIQKTCRDDQGAIRNTRSFNGNPQTEMWLIGDWDLGVTEPGSSGSPLFNEDGQIIGVLSGGAAACNGTNDNGGIDYYGRVDVGWDFGTQNSSRLEPWLDPAGTGVQELDAYTGFAFDLKVELLGVSQDACDETFNPEVKITNLGTQVVNTAVISYMSGTNSSTLNYSGTLASGASAILSAPSFTIDPTRQRFVSASLVSVNGQTDDNTLNDSSSQVASVQTSVAANSVVNFNLTTDNYGDEVSWRLTNTSTGILVGSRPTNFYADNITVTENLNITPGDCYTFEIFDAYGDGICCAFGAGSYTLVTDSGVTIFSSTGDYGPTEVTDFKIAATASVDDIDADQIQIYPNPSSGIFEVDLKDYTSTYQLHDLAGRLIQTGEILNSGTIDLSAQADGVYLIKVQINGAQVVRKLIKN